MAQCKIFDYCGLDDSADPEAGLCILHSHNPKKDKHAFAEALSTHRKLRGDKFTFFKFLPDINFNEETFAEKTEFIGSTFFGSVNFRHATFSEEAEFNAVQFDGEAYFGNVSFSRATFKGAANFSNASFSEEADFSNAHFLSENSFLETSFGGVTNYKNAEFSQAANFFATTFKEDVVFLSTKFEGTAYFYKATFMQLANFRAGHFAAGARFGETSFKGKHVSFSACTFDGTAEFSSEGEQGAGPIFEDATVYFTWVVARPLEALIFRDADLRKCIFLNTDLRKAELTNVTWPRIGSRRGVYDELVPLKAGEQRQWGRIERLYRELKQNCEDRHDYERAGDFHYGEKEMVRLNPRSSVSLRFFLTLYWVMSGYGEKYLRPLVAAGVLLGISTVAYLVLGLTHSAGGARLDITDALDWARTFHYSLRVMTLLKTDDLNPVGYAKLVNTIQSLLGPLLVGLFALAVRQRLKR
jgi:hypothetical protein